MLSNFSDITHALYPLGPVATLRFCHLRPRCVSKQRRTTNVIITDRVWWIWCDAGLAAVATRPQRSPHSVASNSRPDYFAATSSRSLFLTKNECCVSAAAAAIWEIQWRRTYAAAGPSGYRGSGTFISFEASAVESSLDNTDIHTALCAIYAWTSHGLNLIRSLCLCYKESLLP